jgi:DNA-binding LacI/PurR family transcriptional regulator
MPRQHNPVTLQSIAAELGVSRTTVSNAYNRPDQLTDELRTAVLELAKKRGYRGPSAAGRMLRTGKRNAVALLFTEDLQYVFRDPDTLAFMQGVAETTTAAATGLMLVPVPVGTDPASSALPMVAVDGYLVYSVASDHPVIELIGQNSGPVVVVDEPEGLANAGFVGIDDQLGAAVSAQHLIDYGHHRIGIITQRLGVVPRPGVVDTTRRAEASVRVGRRRLDGSLGAMAAAGIEATDVPIWEASGNDPDAGRQAARALLHRHPDVTALLCFTDQLAIGAVQAAQSMGIDVPEHLSVMGFDDTPRASTWEPPLSTIRQPLVDKGRIAAKMLLDAIDGKPARHQQLPIELIVRASTGPVRE